MQSLRSSLFVLSSVLAIGINAVPSEGNGETERIIGGSDAAAGQFPWMVALHYNNEFVCTASIISPTTILTAAHCVFLFGETQDPELFYGIANVSRSAPEVRIEFASITPHPDYNDQSIDNDIAVLTTLEPIEMSASGGVRPVCIAAPDTDPTEYRNATAMGWGNICRFGFLLPVMPDTLQYVEQRIVDNRLCSYLNPGINDEKICAKGFGWKGFTGICTGDSGGPLVHLSADKPPVQIGVASYINDNLGCGSIAPGVWTRVSSHYDFILQNADDSSICTV